MPTVSRRRGVAEAEATIVAFDVPVESSPITLRAPFDEPVSALKAMDCCIGHSSSRGESKRFESLLEQAPLERGEAARLHWIHGWLRVGPASAPQTSRVVFMSQPITTASPAWGTPRFYVTPRQRLSLGPCLLALLLAAACLFAVLYALNHSGHARTSTSSDGSHPGKSASAADAPEDDEDDPSSVDTIYLGDPAEAPVATRPARHPSAVHPFVVIRLPRSGDQVGQIPDTPTGRLLYDWLAAFNGRDHSVVAKALPTAKLDRTEAAQLELRRRTGGFTLVSAREVQTGVLVFRLHDQTVPGTEFLGTLQANPNSSPASIGSFSLSAVPQTQSGGR